MILNEEQSKKARMAQLEFVAMVHVESALRILLQTFPDAGRLIPKRGVS